MHARRHAPLALQQHEHDEEEHCVARPQQVRSGGGLEHDLHEVGGEPQEVGQRERPQQLLGRHRHAAAGLLGVLECLQVLLLLLLLFEINWE